MAEVKLASQPGEGGLEAVDLLAQAILGLPAFQSLGDSGEIYKYLNAKTFRATGLTNVKTRLPPGDDVVWELRELSYPVAMACGSAKTGRTLLRVAAAGPIAAEFQSLLNNLVWLAPGDPETRALAAGQRGYLEFLVSRSERGSQ